MTAQNRPTEAAAPPFLPQELDALQVAFPTNAMELLPPWDAIPDDFKQWPGAGWTRLVSDWFGLGLRRLEITPRDGIDRTAAMRHVRAIMGSWDPQHEHKIAGCAYLLSLWFEADPIWEPNR